MQRRPRSLVTVPDNHRPAMAVPKGGASCANCVFYRPPVGGVRSGAFGACAEPNFRAFYGTMLIPCPPDEFCSDWYEPKVRVRDC